MKILIVTGGSVDYDWAKEWIKENSFDYIIAADSGLNHAKKLDIKIDFLLGDYDSVDSKDLEETKKNVEFVTYPCEKDYTDTHIAIIKAVKMNPDEIYIIGGTGDRFDHTMTNIFNMKEAVNSGVSCYMFDPKNKIYIKDKSFEVSKNKQYGDYISFIPMTEDVIISLSGVKYPLDRFYLEQGLSVCQSNEIIDDIGKVDVFSGKIVVFETKD